MPVYVDNMHQRGFGRFGRMKMSHMIADSSEELLQMADKIGLDRRWVQYPGTPKEHFDVSLGLRSKAVKAGALELTMRQLARKIRWRGPLDPADIL